MVKIDLELGDLEITDLLQRKIAILGDPGTGKTQSARMLAFRLSCDYPKLGIVILDVIGVIKIRGFHVIKITKKSIDSGAEMGKLLAKIPHDHVIINMGDLLPEEMVKFVNAMLETWKPHDCLMIVDESHMLVGQGASADRYAHELERWSKIGRNFNVAIAFLSQRPAKLSKDVLELCDYLIVLRINGTRSRQAVENYISGFLPSPSVKAIMSDIQTMPAFTSYVLDFRA